MPAAARGLGARRRAGPAPKADLLADARAQAARGSFALAGWHAGLPERARVILEEIRDEFAAAAEAADAHADENDSFPGFTPASEQAA